MSKEHIQKLFFDIINHADDIEYRSDDSWYTMEAAVKENTDNLEMCKKLDCNYILIGDDYNVDIEL